MNYPYNPYLPNPYLSQQAMLPQQVMLPQQQAAQQSVQQQPRVSGRDEAMNRFLMMYPANMLVPGFTSEALFDIDGRHFHALSIEADGSRNLETFSYQLDTPTPQFSGSDYVSRAEFDELVSKINKMTGGTDGIPQSVQSAEAAGKPA